MWWKRNVIIRALWKCIGWYFFNLTAFQIIMITITQPSLPASLNGPIRLTANHHHDIIYAFGFHTRVCEKRNEIVPWLYSYARWCFVEMTVKQ